MSVRKKKRMKKARAERGNTSGSGEAMRTALLLTIDATNRFSREGAVWKVKVRHVWKPKERLERIVCAGERRRNGSAEWSVLGKCKDGILKHCKSDKILSLFLTCR